MARGKRFSPEPIIATPRQIEVPLAQGRSLTLACKESPLSPSKLPCGAVSLGRPPQRAWQKGAGRCGSGSWERSGWP